MKDLRQLCSSVKVTPHHLSHLSHPAPSNFNWEVFPVWSINLDSCGPDLPLTIKAAQRQSLWPLVGFLVHGEALEEQETLSELRRASSLVCKASEGRRRVWRLPMNRRVVSSIVPVQREPRPWGPSPYIYIHSQQVQLRGAKTPQESSKSTLDPSGFPQYPT